MKLVIFGLTISSSWGNGHATLWRGLVRELTRRGHAVVFFEKDVPYYAQHRDMESIDGGELLLYSDFKNITALANRHLNDADVGMITSYCPDGIPASNILLNSSVPMRIFYDMDTPVTLQQLRNGETVPYIPAEGLGGFDLVLSFTGGLAVSELKTRLHARRVATLYGSVDPEIHRPLVGSPVYRSDLSYLGTYSEDRQATLNLLFLEPARRMPDKIFRIGGSLYPQDFPWLANTYYSNHVPPGEHPAFHCSSRLSLNVTRGPMAELGYCPSGRLFEAASCGIPLISDTWQGLDEFFKAGDEIIPARTAEDVLNAMTLSDAELGRIARAARERTLGSHTAECRALEFETILSSQLA
jgi:spore maturation protein CgeB